MESIGRYRIIGELGRGAMGVVYHAIDPAIGRSVAIKTIRIRDINDTQQRVKLRERLFREARSAGVLSHPNIVTIYDMDEIDGLAYIAMAYVNGPTLEKILSAEAPLSGSAMLRVLRQTASALDYAHSRGIVHRDVKPANIMTDEDGAVKITDFGIAKITAGGSLTDTTSVVGTPNYMSPEQVQGIAVDGRSDQFSLAVIAYEILTGERPFQGEHLSTVVYKIVAEDPERAHQINGTLTARIDEVLRQALSKKPEGRYPSCANFVGALEMACAESRGWQTLAAGSAAAMTTIAVDRHIPHDVAPSASQNNSEAARQIGIPPPARDAPPAWEQPRRPSRFVPVMLSVVVALSLLGAVMWQAGQFPHLASIPGLASSVHVRTETQPTPAGRDPNPTVDQAPAAASVSNPEPVPGPADAQATPSAAPAQADAQTAPPPPAAPRIAKPSPLVPPSLEETSPPRVQETVRVPKGHLQQQPQDVWVTTNPPGAKVVLDDDLSQTCRTPCMLHGPAGVHHLTVSQAGYLNEYREIHVGDTAQDVPLISLREASGTLMVTSLPPGASVRINGQLVQQVTPAAITLRPGTYSVTVEKGGRSRTERIEVQQSPVFLQIPLAQ